MIRLFEQVVSRIEGEPEEGLTERERLRREAERPRRTSVLPRAGGGPRPKPSSDPESMSYVPAWAVPLAAVLALVVFGWPTTSSAADCSSISQYPGVFSCLDFEDPNLDGTTFGWANAFPTVTPECPDVYDPNTGNGGAAEGPSGANCVDVVTESACGDTTAGPESDCVFGGLQAMGSRMTPGTHNGFHGSVWLPGGPYRSFHVTRARKYSKGAHGFNPAFKDTEYGDSNSALFGAATYAWWMTEPLGQTNPPWFGGVLGATQRVQPVVNFGYGTVDPDTSIMRYAPDHSVYRYGNHHGNDQWACEQLQIIDWGLSTFRVIGKVNGRVAFDVEHDQSSQVQDPNGLSYFQFDAYLNTLSSDTWYRYQDNIAHGTQEIPCGVIGFADTDSDGVVDVGDNCTAAANADQRDEDDDGFGTACDADVTNNGVVDGPDYSAINAHMGSTAPSDMVYDLSGNGVVDLPDVFIVLSEWGNPPGPSGFSQ